MSGHLLVKQLLIHWLNQKVIYSKFKNPVFGLLHQICCNCNNWHLTSIFSRSPISNCNYGFVTIHNRHLKIHQDNINIILFQTAQPLVVNLTALFNTLFRI